MEDKKSIEILKGLLERGVLVPEEEEAVRSAIGVLSWTTLSESRLKGLKEKRDKRQGLGE
ncbi:MAG: hypothetical protein A2494_01775 [Candidatus Lloydbacteria bacterium RIFOXYC12_FULL_46_25]|uniref:CARD domain-containing protein n=1 Tax=Candidatus Lloydbacteria bacterium RIFOXYC12_FULL_46_25 TaxID=1798670 RepID=A0A1G2E2B0_9BACT|nr:MAG: hypothetical protein A2494_01775 [Candidatus Lloydbacteria bacterium RIFOXYC12_FULL_46_25]